MSTYGNQSMTAARWGATGTGQRPEGLRNRPAYAGRMAFSERRVFLSQIQFGGPTRQRRRKSAASTIACRAAATSLTMLMKPCIKPGYSDNSEDTPH